MTRLDERLRGLDEVDVPDVWRIARERGSQRPNEPAPSLVRRVATIALALVIAAAGFAFAVSRLGDQSADNVLPDVPADAPVSCQPDDAATWRTKMVPWLTSVLVSVGGPDGQPLTASDISDTGSALRIGSDRAEVVVYVYADVPDLEHDPRPFMQRTGSIGDYALYSSAHATARQYSAFGPEAWLSLYAYASTPDTAARWADGTDVHSWLQDMIARFAVNPIPSC
jgi:anti-sigma factor RsiW